jgi:aerobic C4-dicarboxylate transport protein
LTPTNLIGNTLATIVVAKWENALDEERLHRMLDGGPAESASSAKEQANAVHDLTSDPRAVP